MHQLIANFSLPAWFWIGLGVVITLFLVKPGFRKECDAFFARLLGMRPKRTTRREPEEDEEEDET